MKKEILMKVAVLTLLALAFAGNCFAGNTVSIAMSCTIPAIPGVNAPPYRNANEQKNNEVIAEEKNYTENESETKSQELIQQENEREIQLADGNMQQVNTQTIYSR
ncbi:MAG: hypothetical protein HY761_04270 [Candidatus Omnitrophica bacterium]|nr:hypothetical protein [Candidatus Omnitrophota bacterium]